MSDRTTLKAFMDCMKIKRAELKRKAGIENFKASKADFIEIFFFSNKRMYKNKRGENITAEILAREPIIIGIK